MRAPERMINFLRWFCREDYIEEIEGDLTEVYSKECGHKQRLAKWKLAWRIAKYLRPEFIKPLKYSQPNSYGMYKSYFKIGWRNLLKNKGYSAINIGGLAIGLTVTMFIGLWVHDELSFNKYHKNYNSIAQVYNCGIDPETSEIFGGMSVQYPVSTTLRTNYPQYFRHVVMAPGVSQNTLSFDDKKTKKPGLFVETGVLEMLSLKMLKGTYKSLNHQHSVVLSASTAKLLFGDEDPMNKALTIDGNMDVQVTGVYEDIPRNNRFSELQFLAPWNLWLAHNEWARRREADWDNCPFNIYVQLQPNVSMEDANAAIKDLYYKNVPPDLFKHQKKYEPFVQLVPMSTWHLYSEFKNGKPSQGRITYVWLFGIVGVFVLLIACINFVNLSTARSEKRAKEVGIRKVIGSRKGQLVSQFLSESFMIVLISFTLSILALSLLHDWFNHLTDKGTPLPFLNPYFWMYSIGFILITGFVAGVYPAFYLSSFQPVKVLKGVSRLGNIAALPRKVMVIMQYTASVVLIVGTIVVYKQIQFARNRPVGYNRESLITVEIRDPGYKGKVAVLRDELLNSGAVTATTISSGPLTSIWNTTGGYDWPGKDPNVDGEFAICNVIPDFGKTVQWEIVAGRDYSTLIASDSTESIVVNEAAVKYMGLNDPVGQDFTDLDQFGNRKWTRKIIGVVRDLVMESPYEPARPTLYFYNPGVYMGLLHIRINPSRSAGDALPMIKEVFKKVAPTALFDYKFVDEEYASKFGQEERIGKLSALFAALAIIISCLGLFGLASYVAEQRTKEIGIRKVLGASVPRIWKMLSGDFVTLVLIACVIASPLSFYLMDRWLVKYEYHTEISWWIFVLTAAGAMTLTLLTVSFQAIKAALMSPVNSLRSE